MSDREMPFHYLSLKRSNVRRALHWAQSKLDKLAYEAHAACAPSRRTKKVGNRNAMKAGLFAIPDQRKYPIHNAYHAKLALSFLMRVAGRHGTTGDYRKEARQVVAAVKKHLPHVFKCEEDLVVKIRKAYRL